MTKIWIDITRMGQANLFGYMARRLSPEAEIMVTTFPDPRLTEIMHFLGIPFKVIGGRGWDPLQKYADRILALTKVIEGFKPDLLISDLDPASIRSAFGLGIPAWAIYSNTRDPQREINRMSYPLCEKIFASSFFGRRRLADEGIALRALVEFKGFNECYIKSQRRRRNNHPRILLRPNGHDHPGWLAEVARGLLGQLEKSTITILTGGSNVLRRVGNGRRLQHVSFMPYPPVIDHDLYVGWGRMLGESYVLGVPSIRTVDENHPDLSLVYSEQPEITDPSSIVRTSAEMLGGSSEGRASNLVSPIESVMSALRKEGLLPT